MKKIIQFSWLTAAIYVSLFSPLLSFTFKPGAHSFQIYLDSKMAIEQYVNSKMEAPTLLLDPTENHNQLIVKYNECGRTVAGRKLILKNENNAILKEWSFEGSSTGYKGSMTCNVKDIVALKGKGSKIMKLYYASDDFQAGQQIARIVVGSEKTAHNE